MLLAERLEPGGKIHGVTVDRVALAPATADVANGVPDDERGRLGVDGRFNSRRGALVTRRRDRWLDSPLRGCERASPTWKANP